MTRPKEPGGSGERYFGSGDSSPSGAMATAGPEQSRYPGILEIWDAVVLWVQQHKFELTDEPVCCYEIWHSQEGRISVVQPFVSDD